MIGFATGCIYALLASGLTLAYAVSRQLHLTHGDFLAISIFIVFVLVTSFGIDPYLGLLVTAPVLFVCGLLMFRVVVKPLLKSSVFLTFQVYLGLILVIENVLLNIFKSTPRAVPSFISMSKVQFTDNLALPTPYLVAVVVSLLVAGSFYWMLRSTDFGRGIRAVAYDAEVAGLMGVKVTRVRMVVFGLAFVLIALAGSLVAPWWRISPYGGLDFTLFATIVLVAGGMGNFVGAILAGLIFGVMQSIGGLLLGSTMGMAIPYAALLAVLILRPQGILRGMGMGVGH